MICLINIITTNTCSLFGMWCRWVEGWGAGLTLISRMIYHLGAPNIFLEDLGDKKSKFYAMCFYLFKRVGPQKVVNYIWKSTTLIWMWPWMRRNLSKARDKTVILIWKSVATLSERRDEVRCTWARYGHYLCLKQQHLPAQIYIKLLMWKILSLLFLKKLDWEKNILELNENKNVHPIQTFHLVLWITSINVHSALQCWKSLYSRYKNKKI